jgi:hypothetical protein
LIQRWPEGLDVGAHSFDLRDTRARVVFSVRDVTSVDFVTNRAGRACYVRRRLPCAGVVIRDGCHATCSDREGVRNVTRWREGRGAWEGHNPSVVGIVLQRGMRRSSTIPIFLRAADLEYLATLPKGPRRWLTPRGSRG